jgi:hypothetical protein
MRLNDGVNVGREEGNSAQVKGTRAKHGREKDQQIRNE